MEQRLFELLLKGETITVNQGKKTVTILDEQIFVSPETIILLDHFGFIVCDSGNFETGDRHYEFNFSALNNIKELDNAFDICCDVNHLLSNVIASGESSSSDKKNRSKARSFIKFFTKVKDK